MTIRGRSTRPGKGDDSGMARAPRLVAEQKGYQALIEAIPDVVFRLRRGGLFLFVHAGSRHGLFVPAEDTLGRTAREILPDWLADLTESRIEAALATGEMQEFQYAFDAGDVVRHFESRMVPCAEDEVLALVREITDQKEAERALRASEEKFRGMAENIADTLFQTDAEGRITYLSPAAQSMFGQDVSAMVGRHFRDVLAEECLPSTLEAFADLLATGTRTSGLPISVKRADGGRRHGELSATVRRDGLRVLGTVGLIRDVTERKEADEERQRLAEQLQHAMKMEAIGRLAGGVAHDFNNLLMAISGNLELAMADLRPDDPLLETLREAGLAAESAAVRTRRLLTFARQESIEPKLLAANETVRGMRDMLGRLIGQDVLLRISLSEDAGAVRIDEGQLEQILVNLAVNARDAMPDGGELHIETTRVRLDDAAAHGFENASAGDYLRLRIRDTGHGMDADVQRRVFEPFYTTKEKGRGTGLGLATTYGSVRQAGGFLALKSAPGEGTVFDIYLPRVEGPAKKEAAPERELSRQATGETVLLVEDEPGVLRLARKALQRQGYQVLAASDGVAALALVRKSQQPIDLLMTDIVMPGMGGRELAERMLALRPDLRVLYTSGYTEDRAIQEEAARGQHSFLGKPYRLAQLANKVREVLDKP